MYKTMVDICPIWTVMVISISTIARIWRHILVQNQHKCIPAISMGIPEAITVISIAKNIGQLFKSCLV
jgi:hypothetical protein